MGPPSPRRDLRPIGPYWKMRVQLWVAFAGRVENQSRLTVLMTPPAPSQIIAHRGASHEAPENTLAAIALGLTQQADAIEIDVRLSRDGGIVLLHDDTFRRTGGHDAEPGELDLVDIRRLDAGSWKGPAFVGEKVPTLAEVLAAIPAGKDLLIELKSGAAIVPVLQRELKKGLLPLAQVVVIAFDFELLCAVRAVLPQVRVLHLAGGQDSGRPLPRSELDVLIAAALAAGFDGLNLGDDWPWDEAMVQRIHQAGLRCYVWTVNEADRARYLDGLGVDGITTDRPGYIRRQLKSAASDRG
jgi:glycerophosphoryl diester phosphodiesterase